MRSARTRSDRIRDWVEGRLDDADVQGLSAELHSDATFAAQTELYRMVHVATVGCDPGSDGARLRFDELWQEKRRRSLRRSAALSAGVAAVLLLWIAVVGLVARRDGAAGVGPSASVTLRLIPIAEPAVEAEPSPPIPAPLVSYEPVRDGSIQWLGTLKEALDVARATQRPLLVHETVQACPLCARMEQSTLRDQDVLSAVQAVVPVRIDIRSDMPRFIDRVSSGEWPHYEVRGADRELGSPLHGMREPSAFRRGLLAAVADQGSAHSPSWAEIRRLARLSQRAIRLERSGELGRAYSGFLELSECGDGGSFARAGRRGVTRVLRAAHRALVGARDAGGNPEARALLRAAIRGFAESPLAIEFQSVLAVLDRTNQFPKLLEDE